MVTIDRAVRPTARSRLRILIQAGLLLVVSTSRAESDPIDDRLRDGVRELAYAGLEAYVAQDYPAASDKLEESFRLLKVPSLGLWSARALVKVGKLVEALDRYRTTSALEVLASDSPVQASAKLDATRELQELLAKIPLLSLRFEAVKPDEVEVDLDGRPLQQDEFERLPVNPGQHVVSARRGTERAQASVESVAGGHAEVWLRFEPTAPPPGLDRATTDRLEPRGGKAPSALRTGGWIALGTGGACMATSVLAYAVARNKYSDFERRDLCVGQPCSSAEIASYNRWRSVYGVGLVSGGVFAAVAAGLLLVTQGTSDDADPQPLTLQFGPTSASLFGRF